MKIRIVILMLVICEVAEGQNVTDSLFEDIQFALSDNGETFFKSPNVDFIQINSSITDSVKVGIAIYKPEKPSRILLMSHGWHQSVKPPTKDSKNPKAEFLTVQVDMRGRKYSTGKADCNGYELYDFYDAYRYVIRNYKEYITDTNQVYYYGSSGGGANGYGLLGKFPDLYCSAVISCGPSDFVAWFKQDTLGEFRDEMIPWIGCTPDENMEAYQSRSGITTVENILTPVTITQGETDVRVPISHSRNYYNKALKYGKEVHFKEFPNVGTRRHWGNITPEQSKERDDFQKTGLQKRNPPELPDKGEFIVAGYLVTKKFSVFLNSVDSVGRIRYDLKKKKIEFLEGSGTISWY